MLIHKYRGINLYYIKLIIEEFLKIYKNLSRSII